jgi:3-aminobutyryl-CoA ammonia-lyase
LSGNGSTATTSIPTHARVGYAIKHRRYIPFSAAHYAGNLLTGGYVLSLFSDIATDMCLHMDSDEGLFAGYSDVQFAAPVHAGDVLEVEATVTRVGNRSRTIGFEARVLARSNPQSGPTAGTVLDTPLRVVSATGTVVVPLEAANDGRQVS